MLPLVRALHWGPLIALSIINCVTFTTLYMTSQWLSSHKHFIGFINYFVYYVLIATTLYNFFCAIFIGPGYVPLKWTPIDTKHCQYLQFCDRCDGYKCPRAHHCRKCERCILKMDHHCPWINNCCGYRNQFYFTAFLFSAVLGSIHSITLLIMGLYRALYFNWYFYNESHEHLVYITMTSLLFSVFSIGLSIGVIIAVGGLLIIQLKIMIRNQTSIEEWIVAKAKNRRRDKEFIYPYNIGLWNNVKQVLFEPTDNGITWTVNEHCDQYTLTVEQLLQKQEKRSRASLYRAIANYNGRWFPLFSYGCRVCITFPISDEPRISINNGDHVVVTRWKTHWLYGEKIRTDGNLVKERERERERGWFVRKCVVEVIKPTNNYLINANHDSTSSFVINKNVTKKLN